MAVPMSMNRVIHAAVRRDLDRLVAALSAFPAGDAARAADLAQAWQFFRDELSRHHTDEHAIAWPPLAEVGVDPAMLAQFDTEHDAMAAALANAGDAIAALKAAPTADAAAASLSAVEALRAVTVEHLDHEEIELEPVYYAKKDTPQVKAMGRAFAKVSPTVGGNFFAWVENGATLEERAALRENVPGPVVTILSGVFGRSYRRSIAPVWQASR